ncbi:MAG: hypothetical protein E6J90_24520 [Deltaproteobacteria bacterium]|nr:MAG: hypothetical protein E6J90_24520 [Deltaproteobacteria bacterium]
MATSKDSKRNDPLPTFCFWVHIPKLGTDKAFFKSVSGLRYEHEVIPVRAGGANDTTFNLVGSVKWSPLVLKQGFIAGAARSSSSTRRCRRSWAGTSPTAGRPSGRSGSTMPARMSFRSRRWRSATTG